MLSQNVGGEPDNSDNIYSSFGLLVYLSIMTLLSWYSFVVYKWNHSRLSNIPGMSLLYMHIETESSLPNAYQNTFLETKRSQQVKFRLEVMDMFVNYISSNVEFSSYPKLHVHMFNNEWHRQHYQIVLGVFGTCSHCLPPTWWTFIFTSVFFWFSMTLSTFNMVIYVLKVNGFMLVVGPSP